MRHHTIFRKFAVSQSVIARQLLTDMTCRKLVLLTTRNDLPSDLISPTDRGKRISGKWELFVCELGCRLSPLKITSVFFSRRVKQAKSRGWGTLEYEVKTEAVINFS